MHFIQNSWFVNNWIFLLLFLIGSIVVIAYMNNRVRLLKYSSTAFILLFVFVVCFLLIPEINHSLVLQKDLLPSLHVGKSSEENISAFSRIINFLVDILKDKIGN